MKGFMIFLILFPAYQTFASDGKSNFHLINMKCEKEVGGSLDSSPQSPPLDVDDPGTPGCNNWEVNILVVGDISKNERDFELPLLDINYGIGSNLQLKYEVPFLNNKAGSSGLTRGDSKVGIKANLYENEDNKLEMAVYPQVEKKESATLTTLPLLISKKIGKTSLGDIMFTGNLGYHISSNLNITDFISASGGIGVPVKNWLALMGELSTEQSFSKNSENIREQLVKANLGFLGSVSNQFLIYGSLGESIYASDRKNHSYVLTGIRLLTGI